MTEMTDQVRETFGSVGREVAVLPFDEVAFRSQVRRARRRRTGRVALVAGAAAGVVTAALMAVPPLLDGTSDRAAEVAGPSVDVPPVLDPTALPQPLYFTAEGRLMAATPDGEVHDLGMSSEGVVGSTAEGAFVLDDESHVIWVAAAASGEGDGGYTFALPAGPGGSRATNPIRTPVQSVAMSGDGRWLAWLDLDDTVTVWDLKAAQMVSSIGVGRNAYVTSVSDRGVLVSLNGHLTLFGTAFDLGVPTEGDGYGLVSDLAGDFVTVADRDDVTRVYDVTQDAPDGRARLVDSVPGTGRLSPYARAVVSVDGSRVRVYSDGRPTVLAGLGGTPQSAGWLDEDHALVTSAEAGGTVVYLCPLAEASCSPVVFSEADLSLSS